MISLPVLLALIGAVVVMLVTAVHIVGGPLLTIAGGVGVGLYLAAWIALAYGDVT